jgi:hypothetical protein
MILTSGKPASAGEKRVPLAWNGLRFLVPESWEPVRLGRDYLGLESPAGPVMEARWRVGAGNLDPGDVTRRMFSRSPNPCRIDDEAVPPSWLAALAGRKNVAFAIPGDPSSRGVATMCRRCGTLVVLRFFDASEGQGGVEEDLAREVLAYLVDHDGPDTEFALYGIRLSVPGGVPVAAVSFMPGRFDLEFSGPGRTWPFPGSPGGCGARPGDWPPLPGAILSHPGRAGPSSRARGRGKPRPWPSPGLERVFGDLRRMRWPGCFADAVRPGP